MYENINDDQWKETISNCMLQFSMHAGHCPWRAEAIIGDVYDTLVNFSYTAVTRDIDRNSVTIGASAGDQLSIKDCLYCLLLPSANDAANALAEYVAGSINDFALLMNEKAEMLGLKNTHFVNPSGLHDDEQYTTAYDMAKMLQYAMKYPIFYEISSSI